MRNIQFNKKAAEHEVELEIEVVTQKIPTSLATLSLPETPVLDSNL